MRNNMLYTDVVIIGAGPTGLSMAIELERRGIAFQIIDKKIKPVATSNALAVQTRTLEIWEQLGILKKALHQGIPIHCAHFFASDQNFSLKDPDVKVKLKEFAKISFDHLPSRYHFILGLAQSVTEEILISALAEKNISINMQAELQDLISKEDYVETHIHNANGNLEIIQSPYVIACDGAHSWVREKCHIPFEGKELPQHFVLADVEIDSELLHDQLNLFAAPQGILAIIQFDQKYSRIIADVTHDDELKKATSLTPQQLQRLIKERIPLPIKVSEPIWTSGFWIHERMVKQFQHDRIFFAGDAAHIHSPIGGQGMNLGIQDANNLAWKLALVLQKKSPLTILTTYSEERAPVTKKILQRTTGLTKIMTVRNSFLQMLRNRLISFIASSLRFSSLLTNALTQLAVQYPENLLVKETLRKNSGPRAGMRALNFAEDIFLGLQMTVLFFMGLNDGGEVALFYDLKTTLAKKYSHLNFILLRIKNDFGEWNDKTYFDAEGKIHQLYGADQPLFYLVRPDNYVGIRGDLNHLSDLTLWLEKVFNQR